MMRFLAVFVLFVVGVGLFLLTEQQIPYFKWIGHLPGDLIVRKENVTIYFPLTTSLILSGIISLLFHHTNKS